MRVLTENEIRNLTRRTESGGKFNLPADTILTPLARDFLRSKGIDIVEPVRAHGIAAGVGEGGAKKEPEDALVDAVASEVTRLLRDGGGKGQGSSSESAVAIPGRTSGSGPSGSAIRAVVWGIGGDRPGILAAVAELLGKRNVNILEINQTILSGVFAMVVIVDLSKLTGQFGEFKGELEALGKTLGITLSAQRDEIFQYMHRV
jgi:ACT domain-containing protein